MPLTFAHPAAILPLARRLPLSALVVGSMTPDVVYFLRLAPRGGFGHTLPGLFLFCLPAGALILWTFHRLVKRPFVALLPVSAQARMMPTTGLFRAAVPADAVRTVAALLVGAVTHDIWDAFTHASGWGVIYLPVLATSAVALPGIGTVVQWYRIVQHLSTLAGLSALAGAAGRWWRSASVVPVEPGYARAGPCAASHCLARRSARARTWIRIRRVRRLCACLRRPARRISYDVHLGRSGRVRRMDFPPGAADVVRYLRSGLTRCTMDWRDHITVDPLVSHGRACIRGTRVPVAVVLDNLAAGLSADEIVASYPAVSPEAVRAALAYAADLAGERTLNLAA